MRGRFTCLLAVPLLAAGLPAAAQALRFDLGSFTPPSGWEVAQGQGRTTCTVKDGRLGTFVMLSVYDSVPATGKPQADFASEWQAVVAAAFTAGPAPVASPGRTRTGLTFLEGSAPVTWAQGKASVRLRVFTVGTRVFSVFEVGTDAAALAVRASQVQACLEGLRLDQAPPRTVAASPAAPSPGPAPVVRGEVPSSGKGLAGVWMTFRAYPPDMTPRPRYYVFWEDGQVFEDLPREGLAGFRRATSKANSNQQPYWGTYTYQGGAGSIQRPQTRFPEKLQGQSDGKVKVDSDLFHRCRPVDGLRLEGRWTSFGNPDDPDLMQLPQGRRPIFRFTRAGRFTDEGVFAAFLESGLSGSEAGSGTYEIRDHSLVLRYDDGRTKQVACSAMLGADPAQNQDILFFARTDFRKMR